MTDESVKCSFKRTDSGAFESRYFFGFFIKKTNNFFEISDRQLFDKWFPFLNLLLNQIHFILVLHFIWFVWKKDGLQNIWKVHTLNLIWEINGLQNIL